MGTVDIRKVFGENVKHYRKKAGLSQEQLAKKLVSAGVEIAKRIAKL